MDRLFKNEQKESKAKLFEPSKEVFSAVEKLLGCEQNSVEELYHGSRSNGSVENFVKSRVAPSIDCKDRNWTLEEQENIMSSFREIMCSRCFS